MRGDVEDQRKQLELMMKDPEKALQSLEAKEEVKAKPRQKAPAAEILTNIAGSSAAAGSGEFHTYKNIKRKEIDRWAEEDAKLAKTQAEEDFASKKTEAQLRDEEKTAKNRARRKKRKTKGGEVRENNGGENNGSKNSGSGNSGNFNSSTAPDVAENPEAEPAIIEPTGLVIVDGDVH